MRRPHTTTRDQRHPSTSWRVALRRACPLGRGTVMPLVMVASAMLGLGVLVGSTRGRVRETERHRAAAVTHAIDGAERVGASLSQLRTIVLLAAHDPAFRDFYGTGSSGQQRVATASVSGDVDRALRFLNVLRPAGLAEVCFIDRSGFENARALRGATADPSIANATTDERARPFFGPTLTVPVGQVYVSSPYTSPDTAELVVSASTNIANADGQATSMLHAELSASELRDTLHDDGTRIRLFDRVTGALVVDTATSNESRTGLAALDDGSVVSKPVPPGPYDATGLLVAVDVLPPTGAVAWEWSALSVTLLGAAALLLVGVVATARRRRLYTVAFCDALTGLPNRAALMDLANRLHARRAAFAVAIVDLDRFNAVNDSFGHAVGDDLLRTVATRLSGVAGPLATVGRMGGNEFAVVTPGSRSADAVSTAERLMVTLTAPFELGPATMRLDASLGIAHTDVGDLAVGEVFRRADVALRNAKTSHRPIVAFEPTLDTGHSHQLGLLGELRRAIEQHALEVHYQPQIELTTGAVSGVEALVRWNHPDRGPVAPGVFVALAESTSVIEPLTWLVLHDALAAAETWRAQGRAIQVAVNLSARLLADPCLADNVLDILGKHSIDPHRLTVEITETAVMDDPVVARAQLDALHRAGVLIALDDFGTGNTSLAHLHSLPLSELKLDRAFVADLHTPTTRLVVSSVVNLAQRLGLRIVAEGVEDADTARVLRDLGCEIGQGYLWARPAAVNEITAWLLQHTDEMNRSLTNGAGRW